MQPIHLDTYLSRGRVLEECVCVGAPLAPQRLDSSLNAHRCGLRDSRDPAALLKDVRQFVRQEFLPGFAARLIPAG